MIKKQKQIQTLEKLHSDLRNYLELFDKGRIELRESYDAITKVIQQIVKPEITVIVRSTLTERARIFHVTGGCCYVKNGTPKPESAARQAGMDLCWTQACQRAYRRLTRLN